MIILADLPILLGPVAPPLPPSRPPLGLAFVLGTPYSDLFSGDATGSFRTGSGADRILALGGDDFLYGGAGGDTLDGGDGADWIDGQDHDDSVWGGNGRDTLEGGNGNDTLYGGGDNDILSDLGDGLDYLRGNAGDDTYIFASMGDIIIEAANEGVDTVRSRLSYSLPAHVENLELLGGTLGTGNNLANRLTTSVAGATLRGGNGNDDYIIGAPRVTVVETPDGGGSDRVYLRGGSDYTLPENVENLSVKGVDGTARGNSGNNKIVHENVWDGSSTTIVGGGGGDIIEGEQVVTYAYESLRDSSPSNPDRIDHTGTGILIDVSRIDADATIPENQAFRWGGNAENHFPSEIPSAHLTKDKGFLWVERPGYLSTYYTVYGNTDDDADPELAFLVLIEDGPDHSPWAQNFVL